MTILIIAEHDNQTLKSPTLSALTAAQKIGGEVHILVAGQGCTAVAQEAAKAPGVNKVLLSEAAYYADGLAENLAALVRSIADSYSHILIGATAFGKNLLPRIAGLLEVAQVSDIVGVESSDTFLRPIYAGSVVATVQSLEAVKLVSVRPAAFNPAAIGSGNANIETLNAQQDLAISKLLSRDMSVSVRPELGNAKVIVSGGRGLGNGDNFRALLEPLADKLNAALGASRAAVDAGYVPNDYQVGQTGKVVAPDLYIAVGISGAIQHLAGMKDSKVIVAINKDADAPIFQVADYGLVGDLFALIPELTAAL